MQWIVGSDWLWLPVLAVSAMIIVAAMVVTAAATAAAFVVPYRSRKGHTESSPAREPAPGPKGATASQRSFGEPAWGGLPLGADVETRPA